jgi:hypothetical protein
MPTLDDLAGLYWRPKFEYLDCDVPVTPEFAIPQHDWTYRSEAMGGFDVAASGEDESFVIRHDRILVLHLRMTETEYVEKFEPMMRVLWAQAQEFTVWLDANNDETAHLVRLVSPWMREGIQPDEGDAPGELAVDLVLRTSLGGAFSYPYFLDLDEYGDE